MSNIPWHHFSNPLDRWAELPSFVIGEALFILCAGIAFLHAWKQEGAARRRHLAVWLGALVAGTANDLIFMALPLVDNFWQAQASIMLTARMPLYIPCVYIWFMYLPTVAIWRLGLPPLARAALTGLGAIMVYAPYDIVGAKFLWWTWHDTDLPISHRLLGAPIGSTIWVITFAASFAWLVNRVLDRDAQVSTKTFAKAVAVVAAFSTLLMMIQMTVLQQVDGGILGPRSLVVILVLYSGLVAIGWKRRRSAVYAWDRPLLTIVALYFVTLAGIMLIFRPETHRSTSIHQTVGQCHVEATDITGLKRYRYLCLEDFDEDFTFACTPERPSPGSQWYTVCGRAHTNKVRFAAGVSTLALLGLLFYGAVLRRRVAVSTVPES